MQVFKTRKQKSFSFSFSSPSSLLARKQNRPSLLPVLLFFFPRAQQPLLACSAARYPGLVGLLDNQRLATHSWAADPSQTGRLLSLAASQPHARCR